MYTDSDRHSVDRQTATRQAYIQVTHRAGRQTTCKYAAYRQAVDKLTADIGQIVDNKHTYIHPTDRRQGVDIQQIPDRRYETANSRQTYSIHTSDRYETDIRNTDRQQTGSL